MNSRHTSQLRSEAPPPASPRARIEAWAAATQCCLELQLDGDARARQLVRDLGRAGWLDFAFGTRPGRSQASGIDLGEACAVREVLALRSSFADQIYRDQLWAALALAWHGGDALNACVGRRAAQGLWMPSIVSPCQAGGLRCRHAAGGMLVDGMTPWVANAAAATDHLVVLPDSSGAVGGMTVLLLDAGLPGVSVFERASASDSVPMARLGFEGCRVPAAAVLATGLAALELVRAVQVRIDKTNQASLLGMARREIAQLRRCRSEAARDALETLESELRAEAGRLGRSAARLTGRRTLHSVACSTPSPAARLLGRVRACAADAQHLL